MNFIEKHKNFAPDTYYAVTNEEPEVINMLLGNKRYNKIGSIASSGEILLLCLLQRAVESIVAVDHSYQSLHTAYLKALLLKKHGADVIRDAVLNKPWDNWQKLLAGAKKELPTAIVTTPRYSAGSYDLPNIRREWYYTPKAALKRGVRNLGKLSFVHGDVVDLAEYGPFDLLYTSNAHEHVSRETRKRTVDEFVSLLSVGGILLIASNSPHVVLKGSPFQVIKSFRGLRTAWHYQLIQRNA